MRYITGIHAMNIPCQLDTCGDWHRSALKWVNITFGDIDKSIFGMDGIEKHTDIPEHEGEFFVANHVRAALDMIDNCDFANAQGFRENFICNEEYTPVILEGVKRILEHSDKKKALRIDKFMREEYNWAWHRFMGYE